ncbi:MAG: hypothetical protein HKM98_01420 [Gammaproteobacteria bacterium]|nr:hypothetical protein [Gammaproteobacteria bacterium]
MDIVVAERDLVAESADGDRTPIQVRIGRPFKVAERTWSCPLLLDGLGSVSDGLGTDSWGALTVAIGVARQQLTLLVDRGARLVCEHDGSELNLDDLFPQF